VTARRARARGERGRHAAAAALALVPLALGTLGCDLLLPARSPGEKLWRSRCAECHGGDGAGNTPRYMGNYKADLLDDDWEHGAEPGSWGVVIREGVFGQMPANPDLTREQVSALVQYMRQLRGEALPARGAG
jgi:mono/diheme cytochrome c family protein